jgi:hypothetical protein
MTLLNKSDRLFHSLGVFKRTQQNGESSSAESRDIYFLS